MMNPGGGLITNKVGMQSRFMNYEQIKSSGGSAGGQSSDM